MNPLKLFICGFLASSFCCDAFTQELELTKLNRQEIKIEELFELTLKSKDDKEKDLINNDIAEKFEAALKNSISFDYPFDSLRHIGKIKSSDQCLRIYTWNIPYNDGTHKYIGYLQFAADKGKQPTVFKLNDKSDEINDPDKQILDAGNWFGALYYGVVVVKYQDIKYYTLLGFDFNDLFSSKKIVDVLYFNEFGEPVFGKPIFDYENKFVSRIIFEYSAQAAMSLKYNKELDMIIFDHLAPSKPSLAGKFQFYGPDMSYDGLKFENGKWTLKKYIDIRN